MGIPSAYNGNERPANNAIHNTGLRSCWILILFSYMLD